MNSPTQQAFDRTRQALDHMQNDLKTQLQLQTYASIVWCPQDLIETRCLGNGGGIIDRNWFNAYMLPNMGYALFCANTNTKCAVCAGIASRNCRGGKEKDVAHSWVLWGDFDHMTVENALAGICDTVPYPTMIVNSGHGVHMYWRLSAPLPGDVLKKVLVKWQKKLPGSDPNALGSARVLRLPGFYNFKEPIATSYLVYANPQLVYGLEQLFPEGIHTEQTVDSPRLKQTRELKKLDDCCYGEALSFEELRENLTVFDVLDYFGIEHSMNHRLPCPIHDGKDANFSVSDDGKLFTCFSRNCGEDHIRDAINLYCWLAYFDAFPDLSLKDKAEAITDISALVWDKHGNVKAKILNIADDNKLLTDSTERNALNLIFADASKISQLGKPTLYKSSLAQQIVKLLCACAYAGKLPDQITEDWEYAKDLKGVTDDNN